MRVLQINSVCGIGSTGRMTVDLNNLLEKRGDTSVIAYGRGKEFQKIKTIKIGKSIDNYTHFLSTRLFDNHGFASKRATKEFVKKVKEYNPDIIHLHNIHGYYVNIEILFDYLKESNKPVIWTLHDCWSFTGHCSHFDYVNCQKWRQGCNNCPEKKEYPSSIFIDNSEVNYKRKKELFTSLNKLTIVSPSIWLSKLVKKSFLKKYEVKVINNGVDTKVFKFTKSKFRENNKLEGKVILLGVANVWQKKKGLEYFLELEKRLDERYKIVLVGLDERKQKNISKNILVINHTNSTRELAQIYSAADIFINPTLEDNFPTTNLESIACKTPVITFDTGGSRESVDGNMGLVVQKRTTEDLLYTILNFKKLMLEKNINTYRVYDKDIFLQQYVDLYDSLKEN